MSIREDEDDRHHSREERRLRMRRHGRRAYIRSIYFLPSLATLGNAICGFAAMYVSATESYPHRFITAAYLIFMAMVFDALDGRLARFARHTTDFGGQLDSLSDVISFGAAPAFVALMLLKSEFPSELPFRMSNLIWAIGALYMSCAAIRLARFNVSNEHGEQAHFSFLGLPSPGAGGAVVGFILMQQEFKADQLNWISLVCLIALPFVVLLNGLLMISNIRYPHLVNRYLRGRRPMGKLVPLVAIVLCMVWNHRITIGIATLAYAFWGLGLWLYPRTRMVPSSSGKGLG